MIENIDCICWNPKLWANYNACLYIDRLDRFQASATLCLEIQMAHFFMRSYLEPKDLVECLHWFIICMHERRLNKGALTVRPKIAIEDNLQARSYLTFNAVPQSDYIKSRIVLFVNDDMSIGIAAPNSSMTDYFYKNADSDEMIFIHEGSGVLKRCMVTSRFSMVII